MSKILLIDGNSLAYRGYYATANSPAGILKTSTGLPTNAIFSMNNMLSTLLYNEKPTHVLIAFDAAKKTRRHEMFPDYKGGRSKTPEELILQFPLIKEMIQKMGIKWYEIEGWEADDIIATVANDAYQAGYDVQIMSSDKDLLQLVNENTIVLANNKGVRNLKTFNSDNFFELTGHHSHQVPDMKGIMGDPSDNLPGIKGIGEKGANKLILEYGSLEEIYKNIDKITGSTQSKLIKHKEMAFLCKKMATLNYEVDIPFALGSTKYKFQVTNELLDFFEKYELQSLIARYSKYLDEPRVKNKTLENNKKLSKYKNIIF